MKGSIYIDNFTIVIPTFNRLELLRRILDTIPKSIKVIISDNGSSVPDEFVNEYHEFKFFKTEKTLDALENWNNCIRLVQTEWFTIPSDDDLYYENSFSLISRYLKKFDNNDVLIFGHNVIDEKDRVLSSWKPNEQFNIVPPFSYSIFKYGVEARFPGIIFKKRIVSENNCFDTSYKTTAGDSKLIQLCLLNGVVSFIPEVLAAYRVWSNSSTTLTIGNKNWMSEIDRWQEEVLPQAVSKFSDQGIVLSTRNIKDETYARNLLGGVIAMRKQEGITGAFKFLLNNRFPWAANFSTKLRIIKKTIV